MTAMSRGKILLAAGVFYPDVGGPAIHVRKIALRLVEEGVKKFMDWYKEYYQVK